MVEFSRILLGDLVPAEYNPRKISLHELDKLEHNLEQFGLVDPIIINLANNKIIGGHQRFLVLKQKYDDSMSLNLLKLGDIGWVFLDETLGIDDEDSEKALNISLNKLSGEWDLIKLEELLQNISQQGFDTDLTGFKPSEVELYGDEDIVFDYDIFNKQYDKSIPAPTITCPSCHHKFKEGE